jgi:hypothetical protein
LVVIGFCSGHAHLGFHGVTARSDHPCNRSRINLIRDEEGAAEAISLLSIFASIIKSFVTQQQICYAEAPTCDNGGE